MMTVLWGSRNHLWDPTFYLGTAGEKEGGGGQGPWGQVSMGLPKRRNMRGASSANASEMHLQHHPT